MVAFHRIFVIDFAGLGLGEAPDANRFQSVGTDTLGHVAVSWSGKLNLPTLPTPFLKMAGITTH